MSTCITSTLIKVPLAIRLRRSMIFAPPLARSLDPMMLEMILSSQAAPSVIKETSKHKAVMAETVRRKLAACLTVPSARTTDTTPVRSTSSASTVDELVTRSIPVASSTTSVALPVIMVAVTAVETATVGTTVVTTIVTTAFVTAVTEIIT
ncbi:hypothetical protein BC939DRAFT_463026, partial [Gamsiella multidivaricata]|uniref:uncharacterized protein n=1 Tax=Gamsiella multidivaricata TaxID=101098 RepID=UPI0022209A7C